ncbi:MAG: sugar nucleotide-binding protein [Candidatus Omnitrophota bacterium]
MFIKEGAKKLSDLQLPLELPKTVIIGRSGYLGSAFFEAYRTSHRDCVGTVRRKEEQSDSRLDLLEVNTSRLKLKERGYKDALILAGITDISECEKNKEFSRKVNVDGTLELIRQLAASGMKPIFTSSDCVFDGYSGGYRDKSDRSPIVEYGRHKAEVEKKIDEITEGNYLIIRLSKIFSLNRNDGTLLDEMAGILMSGGTIRAAHDQIFCPTLRSDLVRVVADLQSRGICGVVNVCSPERWSRYDLAIEMARALGCDTRKISRVSLDEIGFNTMRPKNTSMRTERLVRETDIGFTPISDCIERVAANWKGISNE